MESLSPPSPPSTLPSTTGTGVASMAAPNVTTNKRSQGSGNGRALAAMAQVVRATDDARDDIVASLKYNERPGIRRFPRVGLPSVDYPYVNLSHRPEHIHLPSLLGGHTQAHESRPSRVHATWYERTDRPHPISQLYSTEYRLPSVPRTMYDFPNQSGSMAVGPSDWHRRSSYHQNPAIPHINASVPAKRYKSRVIIPRDLSIPKELTTGSTSRSESPTDASIGKRSTESPAEPKSPPPASKRAKAMNGVRFDKLDLLCDATLELGPLLENPAGCSCPKSRCIALYCDCFKSGRRCNPKLCTCLNCKNTVQESGPEGARSLAIRAILVRNPRAFTSAGTNASRAPLGPGEQACNCVRSRCLKLYCTCFQQGKMCNPLTCTCVGCLNVEDDTTGTRDLAIRQTLEKRPDAFKKKPREKEPGSGCACKNNQCVRKYCECFRTNLKCTKKCSCKECKNQEEEDGED